MFRRSLTTVAALVALGAVTAGCTTFSDNDAVARVENVELTQDDFETQLTDLGATETDPLDADAVRGVITTWIQGELAALPVDEDAVRAGYDAGFATSGVLCLAGIVVEDEATATDVADQLEGGTPFAELFTEFNIDQQLLEAGGALPCITTTDLELAEGAPFLDAAVELTVGDPTATAPLLDEAGAEVAWVIITLRGFDELGPDDLAIVSAGQNAGVDIHVDPRYGTFDRATSQVVALG